ncbi:MAG: response regulator transcription factor [Flavobacteriales bacterium]|nr:response regulator transcription factor [Flavobacteriales bacterium]
MQKIRTLLVDDHKIVRDGIKSILDHDKEIQVVAEAENGTEAIKYLENNNGNIDVAIMDISMPELNGIDATEIISKLHKNVNILALTMHSDESYILNMIKAGALGYILKDSGGQKLIEAVKTVANGDKYYSNEVSVKMINSILNANKPKKETSDLTAKEMEILKHVVEGKTNKDIGKLYNISSRTIETHRRNIMKKLNVSNTAGMVATALKKKLV